MKQIVISATLIALALMFIAMPLILAENQTSDSETNNTLVISPPPVPTLYSDNNSFSEGDLELNETVSAGRIFGQQMRVWFTFNQEKKIEAELQLARLRLIQANIAARNNNSVAMEKALDAHERIMNRTRDMMSKLDGSSDFKGLNDSAAKLVGLERAIQVHERRISFIQTKLNNSNLTDEQRTKLESRLEHAQNSTAHLVQVSEDRKTNLTERIMNLRNITEEQARNIVEQRQSRIEQRIASK